MFCDINNGFNGKTHNKLFAIFLSNLWDFFHKPVLPHDLILAPAIRYEKCSIRLKKKSFQKWFKFTIGLFQSNLNSPNIGAKMSGCIFDG